MVISETYGAQSGQALKENAPHEAGHYLNLGGPGRNRPGLRMPYSVGANSAPAGLLYRL